MIKNICNIEKALFSRLILRFLHLGTIHPHLGLLGSTSNENIALRQNLQEHGMLVRKKRSLGSERDYVMKMMEMYTKAVQVRQNLLLEVAG